MLNITKRYGPGFRVAQYAAVPALLMMAPAASAAGFTGPFAPANWTFTNSAGGDGFVNTAGAPGSVFVRGANNGGVGSNQNSNADYTIALGAAGNWTFGWAYASDDSSGYDFGGYLLNGVFSSLATNPSSGSIGPIAVLAGDTIGFRVNCTDCTFGAGQLTISNFDVSSTAAVPEPSSLAMMALGLAGVAAVRRRRQAN